MTANNEKDYKKFFTAVGKDEVSSSNLDSSSTKSLEPQGFTRIKNVL